jgi:hypothetical protein
MSDTSSTRRMGRKLRFAAAILGAAIALPGLAVANHTDCVPGDTCPVFNPDLTAGPTVSAGESPTAITTDTPSSVTFRFNTADHTMPVVDAEYLVPKGWQFNFASIRPAQDPDNPPAAATQCSQVIVGEENDADGAAARLQRAENLAGGVGIKTNVDLQSWQGGSREPVRFGYGPGPSQGNGDDTSQNPSVAFLNYDGTTANLCMYLYANDNTIDHFDDMRNDPSCDADFVGFVCGPDDSNYESSREFIVPVTITKLPADPNFGWRISYSLRDVYRDPYLFDHNISILENLFYINDISGGNWNQIFGQPSGKLVVSKTPVLPGTYQFKAILSTCLEGLDATSASACKNDAKYSVTRSKFFDITPPPSQIVHTFGKITGPTTAGPFDGTRVAVLTGTDTATLKWTQPPTNPAARVKGYILTAAIPGDQQSRHIERIITNTNDALADPNDSRLPCGLDGLAAECTLSLQFPLAGLNKALKGEGKYDFTLATIWKDNYRTDSRDGLALCDNGTTLGALCGPTVAAPKVASPGFSPWSIFITKTAWPVRFGDSWDPYAVNTAGTSYGSPKYLLLVDFEKHRGSFVDLQPNGGKGVIYGPVTSNNIQDLGGAASLVSFESGAYLGQDENWRFDGNSPGTIGASVDPFTLPDGLPEFDCCAPNAEFDGRFSHYNVHGLPASSDYPTGDVVMFSGVSF